MLPRTYVIVKNLCRNIARSKYDNNSTGTFKITLRQLCLLHRHTDLLEKRLIKPSKRTIIFSQILSKKSSTDKDQKLERENNETSILSTKTDPSIKTDEKIKEKTVVENVIEGSLEKSAVLSAETVEKSKEKIIGAKEDTETKTETLPTVAEAAAAATAAKAAAKKRKRVDPSIQFLERNFITPLRAMTDFLLKLSDLEDLPKTKRRSPYENEPPMTVYWRKDVEAKAISIWGSIENLQNELSKRNIEKKELQQDLFNLKRRLRDYRKEIGKTVNAGKDLRLKNTSDADLGLKSTSGKVVLAAVAINGFNCLAKLLAWVYTGSHSMFSESIHSLADTVNQLILAYGIHKSIQSADSYHPYGYTNMKYVASLISGVGIFCVGTGLSFYHGISGLINPVPITDINWGYIILSGAVVSEGATWYIAFNSLRKGAKRLNMSVKDYITQGQDPSVNVVLLEDSAAVAGVVIAATCLSLSSFTNSTVPDSVGSLLVGCLLGSVAAFIIHSNVAALVGRSIPAENLKKINNYLESDVMVRGIHDVKGIDMGSYLVRYKAELDFDGRELTRSYLDTLELNELLEEVKKIENINQFEEFLLKHGENIVDKIGGEIDRIELKLRQKFPEIRHCDLEIL